MRPRRSGESFQPMVVRHPDIFYRKQQTSNEEKSKMSFRKRTKGLKVSPSLEAAGRNFVSENIDVNSGFADISSATATDSFAASAVDLEANFNQTEKIGELHESDSSVFCFTLFVFFLGFTIDLDHTYLS